MSPFSLLALVSFSAAAAASASAGEQRLLVPDRSAQNATVAVEIDGAPAALVLEKRSLRTAAFQLLSMGPDGVLRPQVAQPSAAWRGVVMRPGKPDGIVSAALTANGFSAMIRLPEGRVLDLAPKTCAGNETVYAIADVVNDGTLASGCSDSKLPPGVTPHGAGRTGILAANAPKLAEIAIDCDYQYFQSRGNSVASTLADVESVMSAVEVIFEQDVAISFAISAVVVRTAEPDPYSSTAPQTVLNEVSGQWNGPLASVSRDMVQVMLGKSMSGAAGIAYNGVACYPQFAYSAVSTNATSNFALRVALSAHEFGHNLSASHCSGSGCYVMCPVIGTCNADISKFGAFSAGEISSFAASAACLAPAAGPTPLPFADGFPVTALEDSRWSLSKGIEVLAAPDAPSAPLALVLDSSGPQAAQQDEAQTTTLALAGLTSPVASFKWKRTGVESGESLVVEFMSNTQQWAPLATLVSNGSATSWASLQLPLPSNACHDEFRLRFRTLGSDSGDDWFVDDVTVDPLLIGPPQISSILPSEVETLAAGKVALSGSGFSAAGFSLSVGGAIVPGGSVTVVDDARVEFVPPVPSALGQNPVSVTTSKGASAPTALEFMAADPPVLTATPVLMNGGSFSAQLGGVPTDVAILLVSASPSTVPFLGQPLLASVKTISLGGLPANGVKTFTSTVSGVPAGSTLYLQLLTLRAPGTSIAGAKVSAIATTFVLF